MTSFASVNPCPVCGGHQWHYYQFTSRGCAKRHARMWPLVDFDDDMIADAQENMMTRVVQAVFPDEYYYEYGLRVDECLGCQTQICV